MLTVFEFNPAGIRAYEEAGFEQLGRRRGCRITGGRVYDEVYMDRLAPEFERPAAPRKDQDFSAPLSPEGGARMEAREEGGRDTR